jgi:HEAT repeat protein
MDENGLPDSIDSLLELLASEKPRMRTAARERLVEIGAEIIPRVLPLLAVPEEHLRWEGAKTIAGIGGPEAAVALASLLSDTSRDVRWVAAEGLVDAGDQSIEPMLHELIARSGIVWVREAGTFVIEGVMHEHNSPYLRPVLKALHEQAPVFGVPIAAYQALVEYHRIQSRLDRRRPKGEAVAKRAK